MVVDDEVGIRKGCRRVLTAEGHEVFLAETAEEALEALAQHPEMNLTLVDLRMPGMGGLEFLIRARELAPEMVAVVITAYATLNTAIEAVKRGAYDFLAKPFTPDELLRVVNKALERAQLIRERNRLQAEREARMLELATEQSRTRTIINCMADAVLVSNTEGALVLHNPAALKVLPHLQPGRQVAPLGEVLEPAPLFEMIQEAADRHRRLAGEVQLTHLPEQVWVLAEVAPVLDEDSGRLLGTVTVLRDITERKRVEEANAQFVNMVAHELRAPLAAVDGYLSVMLQGLAPDPEKQRQMLSRSRERLGALLELVRDLLDVSRMEAATMRREIAPQQVGQVAAEVTELMQPLAAQKQVTLELQAPASLPAVEADREDLLRLLNNLVSNGIKYNRQGGRVAVSAVAEGLYVRMDIADTGVGISEEGRKRLFGEFFREKRPETAYVTGTGLGLSIVKRIVDFYHGRVAVQSKLAEGSTFSVWLPCRFEAQPAAESAPAAETTSAAPAEAGPSAIEGKKA